MELLSDAVIPLMGIYPKDPETPIQKNLHPLVFIAAPFTTAKCCTDHCAPRYHTLIGALTGAVSPCPPHQSNLTNFSN